MPLPKLIAVCCFCTIATPVPAQVVDYPETRRVDHVDVYHGQEIPDPYRWLEEMDGAETRAWIEAQNETTFQYLSQIPYRDMLREQLTEIWNYERVGAPQRIGGYCFFSKNDGLQNQSVLYQQPYQKDGQVFENAEVLLDPNLLSSDGTVALTGRSFTRDGKLLAYAISEGGSDWKKWYVRDVETGEDLDDHIQWCKFSGVSWASDNSGFYYSRYPEPEEGTELAAANFHQRVYFHKLGQDQSRDRLVFETEDPQLGFSARVTRDGSYLLVTGWKGTDDRNLLFLKGLGQPDSAIEPLIGEFEAEFSYLGNRDNIFYFKTDFDALNSKIIAIDVDNPDKEHWTEIVPEHADKLQSARILNHQFVLSYLHDASTAIQIYNLDGSYDRALPLPGIGTASGFTGEADHQETWFTFQSFTVPPTIYHYDFSTRKTTEVHRARVDFDPAGYETRLLFARSKDGTAIPFFLTAAKDTPRNGQNPTLLYGYGGFNVSITPRFSASNLVWFEAGGIFVSAVLRGGSEYGETWHKQGMLENKQNVFDDFIAVAEYLVEQDYTQADRLAIAGGSNGGLLVGACVNKRPDLFAAAIPAVGVMDMLRYHEFTIGWAWVPEFGSSENPEQFAVIRQYSPIHNLEPGTDYPAVLITTGDHDDRVVPAHSYKYAATLQAAQAGPAPVLIRVETRAGHGAGKPTEILIEEQTDRWAFLMHNLKMNPTN